jgi:hypothetical protein
MYLEVEIRRNGTLYHQRYERGIKAKELEERGSASGSGTQVTFKPDPEIFTELEYSYEVLSNRLRELAFLNKGLQIVLVDERDEGVREEYRFDGGIAEYVQFLRGSRQPLHEKVCYFEASRPEAEIELALQYDQGFSDTDTSVAGAISLYAFYGSPDSEPGVASTPLAYLNADAPPMFIAHGDNDTCVLVDDARAFARELDAVSTNPVVYAELPGAQHGFDVFRSARFAAVVDAIEVFIARTRPTR